MQTQAVPRTQSVEKLADLSWKLLLIRNRRSFKHVLRSSAAQDEVGVPFAALPLVYVKTLPAFPAAGISVPRLQAW